MKKAFLSLILIGLLAAPMSANAITEPFDFNADGKISISDVKAILEYYSLLQSKPIEIANEKIAFDKTLLNVSKNGDVNSDGLINAQDANILLVSIYPNGLPYGDVNNDNTIDSFDSSMILKDYSQTQTSNTSLLTDDQYIFADVNSDGIVDATDASIVSAYYAYISTGGKGTLAEFRKELY